MKKLPILCILTGLMACNNSSAVKKIIMKECRLVDNYKLRKCITPKYLSGLTPDEMYDIASGRYKPNLAGILNYAPECWKYSDYH